MIKMVSIHEKIFQNMIKSGTFGFNKAGCHSHLRMHVIGQLVKYVQFISSVFLYIT